MIGNDVVDLGLAQKESNWKRKGFLEKIFTEYEHQLIQSSVTPELKVWELWSRKEAVYKIFNRNSGIRLFNPKRFECSADGKVTFENQVFFTKSEITKKAIHTIAVQQKSDFDKVIFLENRDRIVKLNGIPSKNNKPVSISNHGRFEKIVSVL